MSTSNELPHELFSETQYFVLRAAHCAFIYSDQSRSRILWGAAMVMPFSKLCSAASLGYALHD